MYISIPVLFLSLITISRKTLLARPIAANSTGKLFATPKIRRFERNRGLEFEFVTVNSKVDDDYGSFPVPSDYGWDMTQPHFLFGDGCPVQLSLEVIDFEKVPTQTSVTLCLFRTKGSIAGAMVPGSKVEIFGSTVDLSSHFDRMQPVTGFVVSEYNSLVHGFILKRAFYGTIRIFDPRPQHHVVFFVEPLKSLGHYHPDLSSFKKSGHNAFVFEYVRHEADASADSTSDPPSFEGKMSESLATRSIDIAGRVKIRNGTLSSNMFDIRKDDFTVCDVCVWVQPNFADKFGFGGGIPTGVASLQRILAFVQFVFEGVDFNGDNSPDNVQIKVKRLLVTDKVKLEAEPARPTEAVNATTGQRRRRQGVNLAGIKSKRDVDDSDEVPTSFGNETVTLTPESVYKQIRVEMTKLFVGTKCCAILAYVYHNMAPKLSYTAQGGICSRSHNIGVISGFIHNHKVSETDVFRSTMHVLGHLFGAGEDDMADPKCKADTVNTPNILNPPVMDSFHKIDVGMRPNSMRYSACAKLDITSFLTSPNTACLYGGSKVVQRCGNGIVETGEECDCGLPWQCHTDEMEKPSCCGESDTILGCRKVGEQRFQADAHCHRPFVW